MIQPILSLYCLNWRSALSALILGFLISFSTDNLWTIILALLVFPFFKSYFLPYACGLVYGYIYTFLTFPLTNYIKFAFELSDYSSKLLMFIIGLIFIVLFALPIILRETEITPSEDHVFSDPKGLRWDNVQLLLFVPTFVLVFTILISVFSLKNSTFTMLDPYYSLDRSEFNQSATKDDDSILMGYYVNWDPDSYESLKANKDLLTHIAPVWLYLNEDSDGIVADVDKRALKLMKDSNLLILPVIQNYKGGWRQDLLHSLLEDPVKQEKVIESIVDFLLEYQLQGLNLDFEDLDVKYRDSFITFSKKLHFELKSHNLILVQNLHPQHSAYNYQELAKYSDFILPMHYDQWLNPNEVKPIGSKSWVVEDLKALNLPGDKLIIGLATYGRLFTKEGTQDLTYQDYLKAILVGQYQWLPDEQVSQIVTDQGIAYFQDSPTVLGQLNASSIVTPKGFGVWRLGSEDPSLWALISLWQKGYRPNEEALFTQLLSKIPFGVRQTKFNPDSYINEVTYSASETFEGIIPLAFYNLKDPALLEKTIKWLDNNNLRATLFVDQKEIDGNPYLVDLLMSTNQEVVIILEEETLKEEDLQLTKKALEYKLGPRFKLAVKDFGLIPKTFVEENLSNQQIVEEIINKKHALLPLVSDYTTNMLPTLIETTAKKDIQLKSYGEILRTKKAYAQDLSTLIVLPLQYLAYKLYYDYDEILVSVLIIILFFGLLRTVMFLILSTLHFIQFGRSNPYPFKDLVTIIVPAYNEGIVIQNSIESLLESTYTNFEIIIVDDGSTDNTFEILNNIYGRNPKIKIVKKENGGKASAINKGLEIAQGEVTIVMDADTIFEPQTISYLVSPFSNRIIGAVSGNVLVGNKQHFISALQFIEYVTSINIEKRAQSYLGFITVVPGAVGAWRTSALKHLGGFSKDTLAEDGDLTLSLSLLGYRIVFQDQARAWTETPQELKSFLKQRYRWTYGTLQFLWKHRYATFNYSFGPMGLLGIPNLWYGFMIELFSPLLIVISLISLYTGVWLQLLPIFLVFALISFIATSIALIMEKESLFWVLLVPVQGLIFRLVLNYIFFKALIAALRGSQVSWNKLQRRGDVASP